MKTHRISVDIEEEEHRYLKMCCAKLGISIKDFVVKAVINKVEEQEDKWWIEGFKEEENKEENFILIDYQGNSHALPS